MTVGIEQETYIANEENGMVTVCVGISTGTSERVLLVTLTTEGGDAEGKLQEINDDVWHEFTLHVFFQLEWTSSMQCICWPSHLV